jgi:tellurite resistance protein
MPAYNFRETVVKIAESREIKLYDFQKDFLWEIENDLKKNRITAEEAIEKLKEDKDFSKLTNDDFEEIVDAIK